MGCLGRFNPAKDHANFVRAAALIAKNHPNCRFLMVGRGLEFSNDALRQQIFQTGYSDRFVLLGERSDPAACIDAMDVFVLSSCTEGFPNVLGEAVAMVVPCISTAAGDAGVPIGDAGVLAPVGNSIALADAMQRLVSMLPEALKALGNQGRERVGRDYSISTAVQRFTDLYMPLVAKAE